MIGDIRTALVAIVVLVTAAGVPRAAEPPDYAPPPVLGQPADFTGAVGVFHIAMDAAPRAVRVGEPIRFTIRITSAGAVHLPPRRPDLRRMRGWSEQFLIENVEAGNHPRVPGAWRFDYVLKARSTAVRTIPGVRFCYYKPGVVPREKGYRTAYARPIRLTVIAAEAVEAREVQGPPPVAFPPSFTHVAPDADAELRSRSDALPGSTFLLACLLAPPLLSVAACGVGRWRRGRGTSGRRLHPAAARACRDLRRLSAAPNGDVAERTSAVVTGYLRDRWGLGAREPTPAEAVHVLARLDSPLERQVIDFFEACAARRFGPGLDGNAVDLPAVAERLIRLIEERKC